MTTTAFVLGGGGVLGAAEVGMLRALLERGIKPDVVVGTSVGAVNGAVVAADPTEAAIQQLAAVWSSLVRDFPELSAYEKSISCAVNEDYSRFTTTVADGDEVAFLPPVSGG